MAETWTRPSRRSPLDAVWHPGFHGAPTPTPGVTISRRLGLAAVQLDARLGHAEAVAGAVADTFELSLPGPNAASTGGDRRVLWIGPDRWLILARDEPDLETRLHATVVPVGGVVVDQSHGRAVLRLRGPAARATLAKGTGIDLHPRNFVENAVAQTALFHLSVTLDRRLGNACFDVHVMRGYAVSLYESLREAAAEYGYEVAPESPS